MASVPDSNPSQTNSSADDLNSDKVSSVSSKSDNLKLKHVLGDQANNWFERNRSMVLRQTPVWAQSLTAIVISLASIGVIAGIFFRIDEVVTVDGQLKSIGGTVDVATPAGGQISKIYFKDGETVSKGQLLLTFDTRQASEQKSTLESLILLEKKELQNRLSTLDSQKQTLQGRREVLQQRLSTKTAIVEEMKLLVQQGGFQKINYLEQLDVLFELKNRLGELDEEVNRLELQENQLRLSSKKSVDQMSTRLKGAELQLQYQNVRAPVDGVIFNPIAFESGVLQSGARILSIVPNKDLYAEVFVPNKDIGFIKIDQSAKVRVNAFPFTRYGEIEATVNQIGADALEPDSIQSFYRFPVKLSLDKQFLRSKEVQIPLKPGMSITTNLKLRDKRVISLISDLLVDQADSVRSIRQQ